MNIAKSDVYVIAEAGVNHNGQLQRALDLCSIARDCGADAVKFQTWKTDLLVLPDAPQAAYQAVNTGINRDQYSLLRELELSESQFECIKKHCDIIGIEFLSTPDEEQSLNFLVHELDVKTIKIGSGELGNIPFLRKVGRHAEKVILSTGMSNLADVYFAIEALAPEHCEQLTLLHCTSSYPCPPSAVNLLAMQTLGHAFNHPVGFSDHTMGSTVAIAATALGAKVIEKHITQSKILPGPDHACSLEPKQLSEFVSAIRDASLALGSSRKSVQTIEEDARKTVTKVIVATQIIQAGETFSELNIGMFRAGKPGLAGTRWDSLIGRPAPCPFKPGQVIKDY